MSRGVHFSPGPSVTGRPGLVDPVRCDPTGRSGPTRKQARGPNWRRSSHGFYVPASTDVTSVEQRIVEAAAVLPAFGAVTGWAALRWMGARWFGGLASDGRTPLPVELVTMCCDIRPQAGIAVSEERLDPREIMIVDGLRVVLATHAVLFAMRYAGSVVRAVVIADMAMESDLVSNHELVVAAATLSGWTGIPCVRAALPLVHENSWSPQETRMRLVWVLEAGFPTPLCNVPVFDVSGRHIGTPDLLDPVAGVVGEYDGASHLELVQRGRDVRREQEFREVGLEYFTVVAPDWSDRSGLVRRMVAARSRARWEAPGARAWTIEKPPWWTSTETVAARRALSEAQRSRLLRRRAG